MTSKGGAAGLASELNFLQILFGRVLWRSVMRAFPSPCGPLFFVWIGMGKEARVSFFRRVEVVFLARVCYSQATDVPATG